MMNEPMPYKNNNVILANDDLNRVSPALAFLATLSESSRYNVSSFLRNITRQLHNTDDFINFPWQQLRRHHVQAIMQTLHKQNKKPTTINGYLSAIKGVMRESWMMQLITSETWTAIKEVKSFKGSRVVAGRSLSRQEIDRLLEINGTPKGLRDRAIFALLIGTGLRRAEIINLNYEDIDFEQSTAIAMTKGNLQQVKHMPTFTHIYLKDWLEVRGTARGALFYRFYRSNIDNTASMSAKRMTPQAIYHILTTTAQKIGLEFMTPHDLRRTFATALLESGEDLLTVRDAMGHTSVVTTQRYDKRGEEKVKKAAKSMDGWLG
jgi:site-specific recombinase XerD